MRVPVWTGDLPNDCVEGITLKLSLKEPVSLCLVMVVEDTSGKGKSIVPRKQSGIVVSQVE